jgi:hypothetical protein
MRISGAGYVAVIDEFDLSLLLTRQALACFRLLFALVESQGGKFIARARSLLYLLPQSRGTSGRFVRSSKWTERERKKRLRVFISHASANLEVARLAGTTLEAAGFDPWLDHSDIRVGSLLGKVIPSHVSLPRGRGHPAPVTGKQIVSAGH